MHCPFCAFEETKVIDSRLTLEGDQVRRRRECLSCSERFTTYEAADIALPALIKRDGRRCAFSESKLLNGILKSLEKRPVSTEQVDEVMRRLKHRLRTCGEREVRTELLGEWVMEELLQLDEVAYVRFASVYKSFQDLDAFRMEIQRMRTQIQRRKEQAEKQINLAEDNDLK